MTLILVPSICSLCDLNSSSHYLLCDIDPSLYYLLYDLDPKPHYLLYDLDPSPHYLLCDLDSSPHYILICDVEQISLISKREIIFNALIKQNCAYGDIS